MPPRSSVRTSRPTRARRRRRRSTPDAPAACAPGRSGACTPRNFARAPRRADRDEKFGRAIRSSTPRGARARPACSRAGTGRSTSACRPRRGSRGARVPVGHSISSYGRVGSGRSAGRSYRSKSSRRDAPPSFFIGRAFSSSRSVAIPALSAVSEKNVSFRSRARISAERPGRPLRPSPCRATSSGALERSPYHSASPSTRTFAARRARSGQPS